jgi:hypothetical protein
MRTRTRQRRVGRGCVAVGDGDRITVAPVSQTVAAGVTAPIIVTWTGAATRTLWVRVPDGEGGFFASNLGPKASGYEYDFLTAGYPPADYGVTFYLDTNGSALRATATVTVTP